MVSLACALRVELSFKEVAALISVWALSRAWAMTEPNCSDAALDWRARFSASTIATRFASMALSRRLAANQFARAITTVGKINPEIRSTRRAASVISNSGMGRSEEHTSELQSR